MIQKCLWPKHFEAEATWLVKLDLSGRGEASGLLQVWTAEQICSYRQIITDKLK